MSLPGGAPVRARPGLTARRRRELEQIVGPANVLTDPDLVAGFAVDWTGRFVGSTDAVVRPGSVGEVSDIVRLAAGTGTALTVQGGNTGLVGGGVPLDGELVLSLRRLVGVEADRTAGQLTAGAGVTIGEVQRSAREMDLAYGVDLASRDSATVGGTVATDAGGVHVVRYGDTRAQLLGVEAVLGDGSVVSHTGGLAKDVTGYHLAGLLCGSEGTLGVVTRARVRLVPRMEALAVALLAFSDAGAALTAARTLADALASLDAVELFFRPGLELVCRSTGMGRPFSASHPVYLLAEVADRDDPTPGLWDVVTSLGGVADSAVATESTRRAALWAYREQHTEAIATLGPVHKLDVSLPPDALCPFIEAVPRVVSRVDSAAATWLFGHAADGNIHVNVTGVPSEDYGVDDAVLRLVAGHGGSISAEHGIGRAKRRWLALNRSPAELAAFRSLKAALDPAGILNPNVLLPPG